MTYTGSFRNGKFHGYGNVIWNDGKLLFKIFKNFKGRSFEGNYINDKKEGYGIFRWTDGRQYLG